MKLTLLIVAILLAAISLAGYLLSSRNHFLSFGRFYGMISPETGFYPTAREVRTLAIATLDKKKTNIIVGGSSVLNGAGQSSDKIWSRELSAALGDDYRVLNLATDGGDVAGIGSFTAEAMSREGYPIIYVSDMAIALTTQVIGSELYRYFYWDARARGYLYEYQPRDEALATQSQSQFSILAIEEALNAYLNFYELKNYISYELWNPRKQTVDGEREPPESLRYANPKENLELYVHLSQVRPPALWPVVQSYFEAALPDPIRRETILVVCLNSPGVSDFAPASARENFLMLQTRTAQSIAATGAHPLAACDGFTRDDYVDRVHLSIAGGQKLAHRVADAIQNLRH